MAERRSIGGSAKENAVLSAQKMRNQIVGTSLVTLVVATALIFGAIRPTIVTISSIIEGNKAKQDIVDRLDAKINALNALSQSYNYEVKEQLEFLSYLYPTKGNFSLVMANIDKVCENNNFYLSSINFVSPGKEIAPIRSAEKNAILTPWQVNISASGNREDLIKLMNELEKMPIYPTITSVNFGSDTDDKGRTNFSINMIIYKVDKIDFYAEK